MSRTIGKLTVYARYEPEKAKKMVLQAFRENHCHMNNTAAALSVKIAQLRSAIRLLSLGDLLKQIEEKFRAAGKHHYQQRDYDAMVRKRVATMRKNGTKPGRPRRETE